MSKEHATAQNFGLDYERAQRILAKYGHAAPDLTPETLAEWLREARERGLSPPFSHAVHAAAIR